MVTWGIVTHTMEIQIMATGTTNQHTANNHKARTLGNGVSPMQDKAQANSRRLESDGVTAGTKSGKNYQALIELRDAAQAQLIIAEAILKANYSREAHVTRAAVKRAFLNACDTVSRF